MAEKILNNSESNISPDSVSRNLPLLGLFIVGGRDACLLETDLLSCGGRYQSFDRLGVPDIDIVDITRVYNSSSITNDDLKTLDIYEDN